MFGKGEKKSPQYDKNRFKVEKKWPWAFNGYVVL